MKKIDNGIGGKIIQKLSKYRNWAFEHWVSYTFLKNMFFFSFFPLIYLMSLISPVIGWFSALPFLSIPVFLLLDSKRVSVAEKSPAKLIAAERVEHFFDILFWILYPLWLILLMIFVYGRRIGIAEELMPSFQIFLLALIFAWTGLLTIVEINVVESSKLSSLIRRKFVQKDKWHLLDFHPSSIMRARARFVVVSDSLSGNPDKKAIGRKFPLFYEGLQIYNTHLKQEFGFILSEPKRLYCQAKLAAYSSENMNNVKNGLESLTKLMRDGEKEPFETIKSLKEMLDEPTSFKDICAEIDADPKRMRKWFSAHSDSIIGTLGLILAVIAITLQFIFRT